MIPQSDPRASYLAHRAALDAAIHRVLQSGSYLLGEELRAFEIEFARYVGSSFGIGVASGTDAIELALRGCGVGLGDLVFAPSHTAVATVAAVERSGAAPILVDVDPRTLTMDPGSLEQAIRAARARTTLGEPRAIVPVHLYGQAADLPAILAIARRHDLAVVEDCAQAPGAMLGERRLGSFGQAAAFSFYPTKNLGAIGDGGMVVTSDPQVADRVRTLREYGWRERHVSEAPGVNSRLDELQAAILRVKLPHLDDANARRRAVAERYTSAWVSGAVSAPVTRPGGTHVYHQYVLRAAARDELRAFLASRGVGTAVHYPVPVHLQPGYRDRLPMLVPLPASERAAREVLSLPIYPELASADVDVVAFLVNGWTPPLASPPPARRRAGHSATLVPQESRARGRDDR